MVGAQVLGTTRRPLDSLPRRRSQFSVKSKESRVNTYSFKRNLSASSTWANPPSGAKTQPGTRACDDHYGRQCGEMQVQLQLQLTVQVQVQVPVQTEMQVQVQALPEVYLGDGHGGANPRTRSRFGVSEPKGPSIHGKTLTRLWALNWLLFTRTRQPNDQDPRSRYPPSGN
ncbi:hypothetical protein BKA70DRAFT_1223134 [Coprinopsis sp. MPI-PUGE-AT-0042]|nr:hypothetical protein BKA70DRAFT_1223134 [Coprinopsis sp. MPI-PUGE-AT-0042]